MNTKDWPEFDRKLWMFARYSLNYYKAEYLLENEEKFHFSEIQKENILRERGFAAFSMESDFQDMLEMGIPQYLLSAHLQLDNNKEENGKFTKKEP